MKRSARARTTFNLSESAHGQLNSYALVASAVGVGMLALAQPVEAKIIYTAAHKTIGASTFIDLNQDGINDFKLSLIRTSHTGGVRQGTFFNSSNATLAAAGVASANQMYGRGKLASALPAGVSVGAGGKFPGGPLMAHIHAINGTNSGYSGAWAGKGAGVQHRFLGLKFTIHGKIHFGWARLNVTISQAATIQATLTGYAYETIANRPIITGKTTGTDDVEQYEARASLTSPIPDPPQPASLGMLALGAEGVSLWRRKESAFEGD